MNGIFNVFRGFGTAHKDLIYRTSNMSAARSAAKRACGPHCQTITIRDVLGGLRGEFLCRNEHFGREWDVIEKLTP